MASNIQIPIAIVFFAIGLVFIVPEFFNHIGNEFSDIIMYAFITGVVGVFAILVQMAYEQI